MITWYLGFFESRSLNFLIAASREGSFVLWAILVCGVLTVVDICLNDYRTAFQKRPLFKWARTYRHFCLTAMAFCFAALVLIAAQKIDSLGLALWCLWNALAVTAFSLVDAYQRNKDATCSLICN